MSGAGRNTAGGSGRFARPSNAPAGTVRTGHQRFGGLPEFVSSTTREHALAGLAVRQHGVVALTQLRALGFSAGAVHSRAAAGRLHRVQRAVYAVGHAALTREGRRAAAVLACGQDAVLSHRSAASLIGLRDDLRSVVDVGAPTRKGRTLAGIEIHRINDLRPVDIVEENGIPCTSVARTLLDLAAVIDRRALERACEQAEVLRVFDLRAVEDVLAHTACQRRAALLRSVLADMRSEPAITCSELEERFLALCDGAGIPRPRVNAWIDFGGGDGARPDFSWPKSGLIVETDGHAAHGTRRAFERDRRRDQRLLAHGWRVVRCTWQQLVEESKALAETIRVVAGTRGAS